MKNDLIKNGIVIIFLVTFAFTGFVSGYKEENNIAEYNSWMKKAILEATGQKEIQKKLIEAKSGLVQVKGSDLIHKHAAEAS